MKVEILHQQLIPFFYNTRITFYRTSCQWVIYEKASAGMIKGGAGVVPIFV